VSASVFFGFSFLPGCFFVFPTFSFTPPSSIHICLSISFFLTTQTLSKKGKREGKMGKKRQGKMGGKKRLENC